MKNQTEQVTYELSEGYIAEVADGEPRFVKLFDAGSRLVISFNKESGKSDLEVGNGYLFGLFLVNPKLFKKVQDRPDWRERYEKYKPMLNLFLRHDLTGNQIESWTLFGKKLDAMLKILCYMEWANEGREYGDIYYTVANDTWPGFHILNCNVSGGTDIIKFIDKQDAKNMLTIPELVEALNEVFNVKNPELLTITD